MAFARCYTIRMVMMRSFSTNSNIARATCSGFPSRWSGIRFLMLFSPAPALRNLEMEYG
jgi:hypothetical protein